MCKSVILSVILLNYIIQNRWTCLFCLYQRQCIYDSLQLHVVLLKKICLLTIKYSPIGLKGGCKIFVICLVFIQLKFIIVITDSYCDNFSQQKRSIKTSIETSQNTNAAKSTQFLKSLYLVCHTFAKIRFNTLL